MENDKDFTPVTLDLDSAIDRKLATPLDQQHYAGNIDFGPIRINISKRPIARNMLNLYGLKGKKLPNELAVFTAYDIWLITYGIQIIKEGGWKSVTQVGLQLKYSDEPLDPRITIIENLPNTTFTEYLDGNLLIRAGLKVNGTAAIPSFKVSKKVIELGLGGKLLVQESSNVGVSINFSILSPKIIAAGVGGNEGEWVINRDSKKPLVGDQLLMQTILTPVGLVSQNNLLPIKVEARVYATIAGPIGLLPVKLLGDWIDLEVHLDNNTNKLNSAQRSSKKLKEKQ